MVDGYSLSRKIEEFLPANVAFSTRLIRDDEPAEPCDGERTSTRPSAARTQEFRAGRRCAREALRALGISGRHSLARELDGAPLWPPGTVASIAHSNGLCVAVAARLSHYSGIGIDIEIENAIDIAVREIISDEEEYAAAMACCETNDRNAVLPLLFVAKESIYKAGRGVVAAPDTFCEIRVSFSGRRFGASVSGTLFSGRATRFDGVVAAFSAPTSS